MGAWDDDREANKIDAQDRGVKQRRTMQAIYDGREYSIPEIWVAGFCTAHGATVLDAVAWWAWQTELAELEAEGRADEATLRAEANRWVRP